jgi:hypothetical protein
VSGLRGLPARLPEGETLLWQGSPDAGTLMRHAFHLRALAAYFAAILAFSLARMIADGVPAGALAHGALSRLGLALVPLALIAIYAWAIERSTVYSITNRRVVISFGLALPMSFNLPFATIAGASLRLLRGGAGDVPLQMMPGEKIAYLVLWPHARPWHMARPQPMLRGIKGAAEAASILGAALSAYAADAPALVRAAYAPAACTARPGAVRAPRGHVVAAE